MMKDTLLGSMCLVGMMFFALYVNSEVLAGAALVSVAIFYKDK